MTLKIIDDDSGVVKVTDLDVERKKQRKSKKDFYRLAPQSYWVGNYPATKAGDFDENAAASAIMAICQKSGIFNINRIRGRGVWMDKNSVIIHYGDKVNIGNMEYKPFLTPGKYVYELAEALGFEDCEPLSDSESAKFPELIKRLRWETEDQAIWLAGWIVCAIQKNGGLGWRFCVGCL